MKTPIANRQEIPETPKPIVEKWKQEKATRGRLSKKKKPRLLARGAEQKLLRRATASLKELKWKLSQSNFLPALSNMQEDFSNLLLLYGKKETLGLLSCGCVARLATVNPEVRETFPTQVKTLIGACTTNQRVPDGLMAIREMKL